MKQCALCPFKSDNVDEFNRHAAATHGLGPLAPPPSPKPRTPKPAPNPKPITAPAVESPTRDFVAKGYNGTLIVRERSVIISHRGVVPFLVGQGLKGDKEIPIDLITAIQIKGAGLIAGYFQLAYQGSVESKGGVFAAAKDENSINFYKGSQQAFERAKTLIEERRQQLQGRPAVTSGAEELGRFAQLHREGVLTDEEFSAKKKQLLGL